METKQSASFWSDRFHSTLIQDGQHFGECLFYIDLNMVRAGAVTHPDEWDSCGYREFYHPKQRFRIVNTKRLLKVLAIPGIEIFRKWHTLTIEGILKQESIKREIFWSRAYAVGDQEWGESQLQSAGIKK